MKRPKERTLKPTRRGNPGRPAQQRDMGEIRHGTVGWEDGGDHFDLESEGVPLLKVTLFAGHNTETQGQNTDASRARGMQILVRFDGRGSDIPHDGEHVIVARPAGLEHAPGSYYLMGRCQPDPRMIPNRQSGEKIIYGPGGNFVRLKEDGRVFVCTHDGSLDGGKDGKTVSLQLSPKDGFTFSHPHMKITAGPNGLHAVHSSGARIDFGSVGGMPPPLDALSSFLKLSAAMVEIEASATAIGVTGGVPDNLVKATPLLAALAAIQTMLNALHTTVNTMALAGTGTLSLITATLTAITSIPANGAAAPAAGTAALSAGAAATSAGLIAATSSASNAAVSAMPTTGPTQTLTGD